MIYCQGHLALLRNWYTSGTNLGLDHFVQTPSTGETSSALSYCWLELEEKKKIRHGRQNNNNNNNTVNQLRLSASIVSYRPGAPNSIRFYQLKKHGEVAHKIFYFFFSFMVWRVTRVNVPVLTCHLVKRFPTAFFYIFLKENRCYIVGKFIFFFVNCNLIIASLSWGSFGMWKQNKKTA
jgi:hypothetical protein